ncbi:recombinase family protein [Phenylobacterium sp.]|uniref:recombinase family protein n=1 Tax=Phenylobacterium sp. TaxID=1871053 RepID=UPI0035B06D49
MPAASPPRRRAVGYLREGLRIGSDRQAQDLAAYAAAHGVHLAKRYVEAAAPAGGSRPALAAALAHARRTNAVLLIARLGGLERNLRVLEALQTADVDVVALDRPAFHRDALSWLTPLARADVLRGRAAALSGVRTIRRALREHGVYQGPRRTLTRLGNPQGFRPEHQRLGPAALIAQADAAAAAPGALALRLRAEGASLRQIAAALQAAGLRPPRGGAWSAMQVKRVLERVDGG